MEELWIFKSKIGRDNWFISVWPLALNIMRHLNICGCRSNVVVVVLPRLCPESHQGLCGVMELLGNSWEAVMSAVTPGMRWGADVWGSCVGRRLLAHQRTPYILLGQAQPQLAPNDERGTGAAGCVCVWRGVSPFVWQLNVPVLVHYGPRFALYFH